LVKGKPWPVEDERKLKDWYKSGTHDLRVLAFSFDNKYSENAVYQKLLDLGLLQEGDRKKHSSSNLKLPPELPSIEEKLKMLAATLDALDDPLLEKGEVLRLRSIISGVKTYKELLADYLDYRELEAELLESNRKYDELVKKSQNTKSN
jgi:cell division protein ZapA (FtsZ GTPase activity inhibitor)